MFRAPQSFPWYADAPPRGPAPINPAIADMTGLCFAYGAHSSPTPYDSVSSSFASSTNSITLSQHQSSRLGLQMTTANSHATWPVSSGSTAAKRMVSSGYRCALWFGVSFGAPSSGTPEFIGLAATDAQDDHVISFDESGGNIRYRWRYDDTPSNYASRTVDVGLGSARNRPISLLAEVRSVGVANRAALIGIGEGPATFAAGADSGAALTYTGNGNERVFAGPDPAERGAAWTPNVVMFGAAMFGGQRMSNALLIELGRRPYALWAPYEPRSFVFLAGAPPAEPGGGSGYKPFKGPFGHPFNVPF